MRTSFFTIAGLCVLAVASSDSSKGIDTEPALNSTSVSATIPLNTASHGTGIETATPSSTGIFNNGTTSETSTTLATTTPHKSSTTTSLSSTSTSAAGAAPTGVWANIPAKGAMAGAMGVLGFALAL